MARPVHLPAQCGARATARKQIVASQFVLIPLALLHCIIDIIPWQGIICEIVCKAQTTLTVKLEANQAMFCPHRRLLINSGEFGEPIVEVLAAPKFESNGIKRLMFSSFSIPGANCEVVVTIPLKTFCSSVSTPINARTSSAASEEVTCTQP